MTPWYSSLLKFSQSLSRPALFKSRLPLALECLQNEDTSWYMNLRVLCALMRKAPNGAVDIPDYITEKVLDSCRVAEKSAETAWLMHTFKLIERKSAWQTNLEAIVGGPGPHWIRALQCLCKDMPNEGFQAIFQILAKDEVWSHYEVLMAKVARLVVANDCPLCGSFLEPARSKHPSLYDALKERYPFTPVLPTADKALSNFNVEKKKAPITWQEALRNLTQQQQEGGVYYSATPEDLEPYMIACAAARRFEAVMSLLHELRNIRRLEPTIPSQRAAMLLFASYPDQWQWTCALLGPLLRQDNPQNVLTYQDVSIYLLFRTRK